MHLLANRIGCDLYYVAAGEEKRLPRSTRRTWKGPDGWLDRRPAHLLLYLPTHTTTTTTTTMTTTTPYMAVYYTQEHRNTVCSRSSALSAHFLLFPPLFKSQGGGEADAHTRGRTHTYDRLSLCSNAESNASFGEGSSQKVSRDKF